MERKPTPAPAAAAATKKNHMPVRFVSGALRVGGGGGGGGGGEVGGGGLVVPGGIPQVGNR